MTDPSPEPPTVKMSSDLQNGIRTSYKETRTAKYSYREWCPVSPIKTSKHVKTQNAYLTLEKEKSDSCNKLSHS